MVAPPVREGVDTIQYQMRAKVCEGIQFDYDATSAQCETFCQYVHGNWLGNFQIPTGLGQRGVNRFTKSTKLFKTSSEPLKAQMIKKIQEAGLIFTNEDCY